MSSSRKTWRSVIDKEKKRFKQEATFKGNMIG